MYLADNVFYHKNVNEATRIVMVFYWHSF